MWRAFQIPKLLLRRQPFVSTSIHAYPQSHCYSRWSHSPKLSIVRSFHTSRPAKVPIIPLPAVILAALKTGKLVSFVSISSKTSLTLLPHTFRRDQGRLVFKLLAAVPFMGFTLLMVVGLDQAPNTSRLRLLYLSEDEEKELVQEEIGKLLAAQQGLRVPQDNEYMLWLRTIVDNIALVAVDDIRDPVRRYDTNDKERMKHFDLDIICDSSTLNAMCAGSNLIVYDLMIKAMGYETNTMAVILSHEIAHSLQRHFVETHGFASLMFMLGDITRGVFWMFTETLGPYVNQKISEIISKFIDMETNTRYNRRLEKEADLVGLILLAKAGYDPSVAVDVWQRMADIENTSVQIEETKEIAIVKAEDAIGSENNQVDVRRFFESLLNSWFGSTHPPSEERIEYMREHLKEATKVYHEALRVNGAPQEYIFLNNDNEAQTSGRLSGLKEWFVYYFTWGGAPESPLSNLIPLGA